jgi:hypothetical protein
LQDSYITGKCLHFQLENHRCEFLLNLDWMSDLAIGLVLVVFSLTALTGCLVFIVKLLHSLFQVRRKKMGGGRKVIGERGFFLAFLLAYFLLHILLIDIPRETVGKMGD